MPAFQCVPQRQNTAFQRGQLRTHSTVSTPQTVQQRGGLRLLAASAGAPCVSGTHLSPQAHMQLHFHPTLTSITFSSLGSASMGSSSSGPVHLTWTRCSRLKLEILRCLRSLGSFRGGVLWPSRISGSPDPQVATVTSVFSGPQCCGTPAPHWYRWGGGLCQPAAIPRYPGLSSVIAVTSCQSGGLKSNSSHCYFCPLDLLL